MEKTQRFSKKRQAIYDALKASKAHPSAETIYQTLKPIYPDLSLGTVYRNLKAMVATGDALCVGNVDGKDRFDGCTAPHLHLICRCCGEVLDLDMSDALLEHCQQLSETWNVAIDLNSLHFTGLCQTCKVRNELAG